MRKIKYPISPTELDEFRQEYLSSFGTVVESYTKKKTLNKKCKEYRWQDFKRKNSLSAIFPESMKEIMTADYSKLASLYELFAAQHLSGKQKTEIESIFNYDGYCAEIAKFFINNADRLKLHSCFYCEMSYVNVFTIDRGKKKHFDVDHVLPKSECPLLALSLFNFVPSCQVCNSRIKRQFPIGCTPAERAELSPSAANYDFESNVKFRLRPLKGGVRHFMASPTLFKIVVKADVPYNQEVKFFHLEERYEYHKMEALRLKDLKAKYPPTKIRSIAKMMGKTVKDVTEDIFHKDFLSQNDRCFRKFTIDILE